MSDGVIIVLESAFMLVVFGVFLYVIIADFMRKG